MRNDKTYRSYWVAYRPNLPPAHYLAEVKLQQAHRTDLNVLLAEVDGGDEAHARF